MLALIVIAATITGAHVRSTDPVIGKALAQGISHSAVIGRLVRALDASDVIVYLARGDCPSPAIACTMMGDSSGSARYLRINFTLTIGLGKRGGWFADDLSIMLAHELQHALEIAEWRDVVDSTSLMAAYARRGLVLGDSRLDTHAGRDAGDERRAELQRRRH